MIPMKTLTGSLTHPPRPSTSLYRGLRSATLPTQHQQERLLVRVVDAAAAAEEADNAVVAKEVCSVPHTAKL